MSVFFHIETTYFLEKRDKDIIREWMVNAIRNENKNEGVINVILTDDTQIRQLNKEYLNRDYDTDVIAFNFNEEETIQGDIFISIDTVNTNAIKYSTTFREELHRVIIHGLLHLIGYNDQTESDKKQMRRKEGEYLKKLTNINS